MLNLIPYCIILRYSAPWAINWVLFLDIHIQICVPPSVNSFNFSYVGEYHSPTIPTIHNCFRQKSVHLRLPKTIFNFNKLLAGLKFDYS